MKQGLLINDDGADSPLLLPFIKSLEAAAIFEDLSVVVPAEERSWISQSVTRFQSVFLNKLLVDDRLVHTLSGTPADCADIGMFQLCAAVPNLCISGINVGINAGWPYFSNSGTVGGAMQSAVTGVPALAVSAKLSAEVFSQWTSRVPGAGVAGGQWDRLAQAGARVCRILVDCKFWEICPLCSINLPYESDCATPIEITALDQCRYSRVFDRVDSRTFRHAGSLSFVGRGLTPHSDLDALDRGVISVTPIELGGRSGVMDDLKMRLMECNLI
jgi:5'/3'-nucleotidase SurE